MLFVFLSTISYNLFKKRETHNNDIELKKRGKRTNKKRTLDMQCKLQN